MGKKLGGSSWLTAVKRAFRSPTKDNNVDKKSCRRREHEHEEDEEKVIKCVWTCSVVMSVHFLRVVDLLLWDFGRREKREDGCSGNQQPRMLSRANQR